jgi:nucleoside-diphosphate-sugar epimerase
MNLLELKKGTFQGIDTLIHLAANADSGGSWDSVLKNNIEVTYNIMEECVYSNVRKIIFASSHHVQHGKTMKSIPGTLDLTKEANISLSDSPVPDSLYAISKLFGENLGQLYHIRYGIGFVGLRIGWVELDENPKKYLGTIHEDYLKSMFLSQRDCSTAFEKAIYLRDDFFIAYVISNNQQCIFDTTESNKLLDFEPKDSIENFLGGKL